MFAYLKKVKRWQWLAFAVGYVAMSLVGDARARRRFQVAREEAKGAPEAVPAPFTR